VPPTPADPAPRAVEPVAAVAPADATAESAAAGGPPPADEPPATPTTRRSPLAIGLLLAAVAVLVVAAVLGLSDSGNRGSKRANATPTATATATATPTAAALSEKQVVDQIGAILAFSKQGRDLRAANKLDAALANRKETLRRVRALEGQTGLLGAQLKLLETAAVKTEAAVAAYIRCGGSDCAPQATHASGAAKTAFAQSFNPLAQRYLNRTYDATDF
jgi:hypothetical protein